MGAESTCIGMKIKIFALIVASYVSVYFVKTARGAYVPETLGFNHVKTFAWCPFGTVHGNRKNLQYALLFPLITIDQCVWHTKLRETKKDFQPGEFESILDDFEKGFDWSF